MSAKRPSTQAYRQVKARRRRRHHRLVRRVSQEHQRAPSNACCCELVSSFGRETAWKVVRGPPAVLALFVLPFRVAVRFEPLPDARLRLLAVPRPDCARPVAQLPD